MLHVADGLTCTEGQVTLFDPNFDKYSLIDLYNPSHPEIQVNKVKRWRDFMKRAVTCSLFERPTYTPPYEGMYIRYKRPLFHVLQAKYEDLEYEVKEIRDDVCMENALV